MGVTSRTQLSDESIGTAPQAPLHTFLSSGNNGVGAGHNITHTQALYLQAAYSPSVNFWYKPCEQALQDQ